MSIGEIKKHCEEQISLTGADAKVVLRVSGKSTKQGKKRLWSGGPLGIVVSDVSTATKHAVMVMFEAQDVLDRLKKL